MKPVVFPLHGHDTFNARLADRLGGEPGKLTLRRFPDGESYVRLETAVQGRSVILVCSMNDPDAKILQLLFVTATARDLGATQVGLVAPYLTCMRQDKRFQPGEGVTWRCFAQLLSERLNWLVTVAPHLHRYTSLAEIYSIPTAVVHSAPGISAWITVYVAAPVLIGLDSESAQWVSEVRVAQMRHLLFWKRFVAGTERLTSRFRKWKVGAIGRQCRWTTSSLPARP